MNTEPKKSGDRTRVQGWLKPKNGARYVDVSERTFRPWLKKGLRHARLPSGTVLIKKEWIDQYLTQFEHREDKVDNIVWEVIKEIKGETKNDSVRDCSQKKNNR